MTDNNPGVEIEVERAEVLVDFKTHFSRYDYDFSKDANTTFYIYLSNFTTPLWFQVRITRFIQLVSNYWIKGVLHP